MIIRTTARAALAGMLSIWLLQMLGCSSTPQEIAQHSLDNLHKPPSSAERADDEAFAKDIGFKSLEEMADAQLASPLRLYTVSLVNLASFKPGDNPKTRLVDTYSLIFPVTIDKQFRSSLIVKETHLQFPKAQHWTSPTKAIESMKARHTGTGFSKLMSKIGKLNPSSSSFLVSFVPLRLLLLGDYKVERLVLTAIEDNPIYNLKAGNEYDAAELFNKLACDAKIAYDSEQLIIRNSPDEVAPKKRETEQTPCLR